MTNKEQLIVDIFNQRQKLDKFISDNNFDVSDYYNDNQELAIHLIKNGVLDKLEKELFELCEDNEVMKEAIKDYIDA